MLYADERERLSLWAAHLLGVGSVGCVYRRCTYYAECLTILRPYLSARPNVTFPFREKCVAVYT